MRGCLSFMVAWLLLVSCISTSSHAQVIVPVSRTITASAEARDPSGTNKDQPAPLVFGATYGVDSLGALVTSPTGAATARGSTRAEIATSAVKLSFNGGWTVNLQGISSTGFSGGTAVSDFDVTATTLFDVPAQPFQGVTSWCGGSVKLTSLTSGATLFTRFYTLPFNEPAHTFILLPADRYEYSLEGSAHPAGGQSGGGEFRSYLMIAPEPSALATAGLWYVLLAARGRRKPCKTYNPLRCSSMKQRFT